ncbi:uncharacterized protein METZ01_LOCUS309940, partial [marine metagenome]
MFDQCILGLRRVNALQGVESVTTDIAVLIVEHSFQRLNGLCCLGAKSAKGED